MVSLSACLALGLTFIQLAVSSPMPEGSLQAREASWSPEFASFIAEVARMSRARRQVAPLPSKCNLNNAVLPTASPALPPPSQGLHLYHVAVGRGTQNYTCPDQLKTTVPVAAGAVARLYNATCLAANHPDWLHDIPGRALDYPEFWTPNPIWNQVNFYLSGNHYFSKLAALTPVFNLNLPTAQYGIFLGAKLAASPAPSNAPVGQWGQGNGAVPWLKLTQAPDTTSTNGLTEVYRVNTAGGAAPATCEGQPDKFEVQYAAEYWFYAS